MDIHNLGIHMSQAFFYNRARRDSARPFSMDDPRLGDLSADTFTGHFDNFRVPGVEGLWFRSLSFHTPMDHVHQGGTFDPKEPYRVTFRALISESPAEKDPALFADTLVAPEKSVVGDVPVHIFKRIFHFYCSKGFSMAQSMFFSFWVCFPGNPDRLRLVKDFLDKKRKSQLPLSTQNLHGFEEFYHGLCFKLKFSYYKRMEEIMELSETQTNENNGTQVLTA